MTKILLAERHALLRKTLMIFLKDMVGVNAIVAIPSLKEAIKILPALDPDILLIDAELVIKENLLNELKGIRFHTQIILYGDDEFIWFASNFPFLKKEDLFEELKAIIKTQKGDEKR